MKRLISITPRTATRLQYAGLAVAAWGEVAVVVCLVAWALGYYPDLFRNDPYSTWFMTVGVSGLGVSLLPDFLPRKEVEP